MSLLATGLIEPKPLDDELIAGNAMGNEEVGDRAGPLGTQRNVDAFGAGIVGVAVDRGVRVRTRLELVCHLGQDLLVGGVKLNPSVAKVTGPPVTALMAACKSAHGAGPGVVGGSGGGRCGRPVNHKVVNDIQMRPGVLAARSIVFFWSVDAAVPARVTVSPLTVRVEIGDRRAVFENRPRI